MGRRTVVKFLPLTFLSLLLLSSAWAAAPALREQISLNGSWPTGGNIPEYFGVDYTGTKTYERSVTVPSSWSGKVVKVEFGAVNHKADVYVNNQLVGSHVGGWNPFACDITSKVSAGGSFTLKVIVTGTSALKAASGKFVWPVGGWPSKAGIADDVWLRAYGKVHIQNTYIKTSTASNTITVDYTIKNSDSVVRTITLTGDCVKESGSTIEKTISSTVTLNGGETRTVTVSGSWTNPSLYWPDKPQLYQLNSKIVLNGATIDSETRRFGFREIKIAGNQYTWNGVRINLFGDYQVFGDTWYLNSPSLHSKTNWAATVDRMLNLNIRCMRWHHNPVPAYLLDICDEKGLLICDESANYARDYLAGMSDADQATYVSNYTKWCANWIINDRNHPSVYIFNATNEMTYGSLGGFSGTNCRAMGDEMRKYDSTRPIGYDGDTAAAQEAYNYHYPEGYNKEPSGSIYGWSGKVKSTQPTGAGEIMHAKSPDADAQYSVERNKWWIGIWTRGLRYTNWTDVRPACFWFADGDLHSSDPKVRQRGINLQNCYAPVALFDKGYDDLGIAPYVTGTTPGGTLPLVTEGSTLNRTLVLYNDEFSGTSITVECLVKMGATTFASGSKTMTLAPGQHMDIPATFQVPFVSANSTMDWILRTYKNGVLKFEESRRFTVTSNGTNGTSSNVVTINGGTAPTNQAPNVALSSPANGSAFTAPATINLAATASDSDGIVSKVEFFANGNLIGTDTTASYSFAWSNVAAGTYSLAAKATDNNGETKTSAAVSITVAAAPAAQKVSSFTLVNADSDTDIGPLVSGATIDLSRTPTRNLNVRANTSPATVGSVRFGYDGAAGYHIENGGPYAFAGGTGTDYQAWTPSQGTHTIKATPYTASNASGTAGISLEISFTVIDPPSITSGPTFSGGASAGQATMFSVSASDPNGDALSYSWNFGDGSTGVGTNPSHTYASAGSYSVTVTVIDGKGGSVSGVLPVTVASTFNVKVNFQSTGAITPQGFVSDTGAVFGSRGNGLTFGWNADNSSTGRDRNSAASPSQEYDTLQHLQKPENPNAKWEIAVPNGAYRVRVLAGDPSYFDSVFEINVENTLVVSATPSSTARWAEGTQTVNVSDGRLTLSNAAGAVNNKICLVEIAADSSVTARSLAQEVVFEPMMVDSMKAGVNYSKSGLDSVKLKLTVDGVGETPDLNGLSIDVDLGGVMAHFNLDEKGRAASKLGACSLKFTADRKWKVSLILLKGNWAGAWKDAGVSKELKDAAVEWPVALTIGDRTFGGSKAVKFLCKAGKSAAIK